MKRFQISNRVFWAGVVLASAALIGRNGGQAQPLKPPPFASETRTRRLFIVDKTGKAVAVFSASDEGNVALSLQSKNGSGSINLQTVPNGDNALTFVKHGKMVRSIAPYPAMDTTTEADTTKYDP